MSSASYTDKSSLALGVMEGVLNVIEGLRLDDAVDTSWIQMRLGIVDQDTVGIAGLTCVRTGRQCYHRTELGGL